MSRNRASARAAGARFTRLIADHFRANGHPFADKQPLTGALDKGDVANVHHWDGHPIALELKDTARLDLPGWWREAQAEARNLGTPYAAVIHKRHGVGAPGEQWVTLTVDQFNDIIRGA